MVGQVYGRLREANTESCSDMNFSIVFDKIHDSFQPCLILFIRVNTCHRIPARTGVINLLGTNIFPPGSFEDDFPFHFPGWWDMWDMDSFPGG